jgi:hypothetical protein
MKPILYFLCSFFLAHTSNAQTVSGVYKGIMEIDSPKNTINFELTLKEKKGKISGYCYRLFVIGDTLYYNLLKVSGKISDSILIVEDERSVSNNFEVSTRGIKTRIFFNLKDIKDTAAFLPGDWQTSFWKKYMPLRGNVKVFREKDYATTEIYKRLDELNLLADTDLEQPKLVAYQDNQIVKTDSLNLQNKNRKSANIENPSIKPVTVALSPSKRLTVPIRQEPFEIYEDNITLSLYDNGEIDGDTVSVFVNDVQVVSKIGLSAKAFKIDIPVKKDGVNKVELYAENLGKIPPNTGLLEIFSGAQRYQIFFTATLDKNAVFFLERKE